LGKAIDAEIVIDSPSGPQTWYLNGVRYDAESH